MDNTRGPPKAIISELPSRSGADQVICLCPYDSIEKRSLDSHLRGMGLTLLY